MKSVKVGLCGLGVVGSATFNVLNANRELISQKLGSVLEITHVGARRDNPKCNLSEVKVSRDIFDVVKDEHLDIIIETIGGTDVARELILAAIDQNKHIVTANKALIAEHGEEIFAAAAAKGVMVLYEASVAAAIPVIKVIREGLVSNHITSVAGIINGTCNYILTEMYQHNRQFDDVLCEAQEKGYAEADPTFDVGGIDAAHKLTILASNVFGIPLSYDKLLIEGISDLVPEDVQYAHELGYRLKHLGIAKKTESGVELRVHPTLIPEDNLMANVNGVMNAVMIRGDACGPTLYCGQGAGDKATASSIVADLVDIVRHLRQPKALPYLGFQHAQAVPIKGIESYQSAYYLRVMITDTVGQATRVAQILSAYGINIEAILQKPGRFESELIPLVILTKSVLESNINQAILEIEQLESVSDRVVRIRVDQLD